MSRRTVGFLLLALSSTLTLLAMATLMPYPATMTSDLGYNAFCPFAPWSTITLLFGASVCWVMRRHIKANPN